VDGKGKWQGNANPRTSIGRLRDMVRFVDRAWVEAWGRANASEPAVEVMSLDEDGAGRTTLETWGEVIGKASR
jgi:hypothetical protein